MKASIKNPPRAVTPRPTLADLKPGDVFADPEYPNVPLMLTDALNDSGDECCPYAVNLTNGEFWTAEYECYRDAVIPLTQTTAATFEVTKPGRKPAAKKKRK